MQQKGHVFRFINGLNESFQSLKPQILVMKPFPTLDEVYSLALREERQKAMQVQYHDFTNNIAMASLANKKKFSSRSEMVCTHCGKTGHMKEKYYQLVGFPANFRFTRNKVGSALRHIAKNVAGMDCLGGLDSAGVSDDTQAQISLSKDQVQKLIALLNDQTLAETHSKPVMTSNPSLVSNVAAIIREQIN